MFKKRLIRTILEHENGAKILSYNYNYMQHHYTR